ncbi:MAG: DUF192 domain-containing protein [Candidatus Omnitrophota bacterium]
MIIKNLNNKMVLCTRAEIAKTPFVRARGLLGRTIFEKGQGLVITACNSIHMFFMKFSIDAVFINQQGIVVGLVKNIKPNRISAIYWNASSVIELPAGTITHTAINLGDQIQMIE